MLKEKLEEVRELIYKEMIEGAYTVVSVSNIQFLIVKLDESGKEYTVSYSLLMPSVVPLWEGFLEEIIEPTRDQQKEMHLTLMKKIIEYRIEDGVCHE